MKSPFLCSPCCDDHAVGETCCDIDTCMPCCTECRSCPSLARLRMAYNAWEAVTDSLIADDASSGVFERFTDATQRIVDEIIRMITPEKANDTADTAYYFAEALKMKQAEQKNKMIAEIEAYKRAATTRPTLTGIGPPSQRCIECNAMSLFGSSPVHFNWCSKVTPRNTPVNVGGITCTDCGEETPPSSPIQSHKSWCAKAAPPSTPSGPVLVARFNARAPGTTTFTNPAGKLACPDTTCWAVTGEYHNIACRYKDGPPGTPHKSSMFMCAQCGYFNRTKEGFQHGPSCSAHASPPTVQRCNECGKMGPEQHKRKCSQYKMCPGCDRKWGESHKPNCTRNTSIVAPAPTYSVQTPNCNYCSGTMDAHERGCIKARKHRCVHCDEPGRLHKHWCPEAK